MNDFEGRQLAGGYVLQSGISHRRRPGDPNQAQGLLLRAVVVATYVADDPAAPVPPDDQPVAVYCDLLVYSNLPGIRYHPLRAVPVSQDHQGLHDGRVWKPRAAKIDVTGAALDIEKATNLANVDGDHVLVGFLDNDLRQPIVLRSIAHPNTDVGGDEKARGHRLRLRLADGDPDFWRHHGTFYGIDDNGDWLVDTTEAHAGALESDGSEPAPPTDGKGAQRHLLPKDAEFLVKFLDMADPLAPVEVSSFYLDKDLLQLLIDAGASLQVEGKDGVARLTLGDGAVSMTISERLETLYGNLKSALETRASLVDAHVHPTAWGPSLPAPTLPGTLVVPPWDPTIASTRLKTPDL